MNFPKIRLTIAPAEYKLIIPGLDVIAKGFADVKGGHYPHRHAWHNIDLVASNVYAKRAFDTVMAARVMDLRSKLWNLPQSKKFRFDPFDLATIAFALRLWKAHKPSNATEAMSVAVETLQAKIERFRRRARRAAIAKEGRAAYEDGSVRWLRFRDWMRYTLLYFHVPNNRQPCRARFWDEQRKLLALAITAALRDHFREISSDAEMTRIVTLLSRSLRRGRHLRSLREVLKNPQAHTNFLVEFVEKRLVLKTLPGAPIPAWKAYTDRADKFIAFAHDQRPSATARIPAGDELAVTTAEPHAVQSLGNASDDLSSERKIVVSTESIIAELAVWFNTDVTLGFERPVVEQAQFLIGHGLIEQYRRQTTSTTMRDLIEELRPAEDPQDAEFPENEYAAWILGCLLALRSDRSALLDGVIYAYGRAVAIREGRHHVG